MNIVFLDMQFLKKCEDIDVHDIGFLVCTLASSIKKISAIGEQAPSSPVIQLQCA